MYVLSLCLLFISIIIKQIEMPTSCTISALLKANIVPAICFFLLMFSVWFYFQFDSMTKGSKKGPYKIVKIENANSDYLVFLTSYIIPLIGFELETVRQIIYFSVILIALGLMYIKTNLFYANPTLSPVESGILLTKEKLSLYDEILIINLGNNISYARKAYIRK